MVVIREQYTTDNLGVILDLHLTSFGLGFCDADRSHQEEDYRY